MTKIYANINVSRTKPAVKAKIFILLLILMGMSILAAIRAEEQPFVIEVLNAQKIIDQNQGPGVVSQNCNDWTMSSEDVKDFFETASPFVFESEINYFDISSCDIKGNLILNGKEKKYRINFGGFAFIYDASDQQGFGCKEGVCLKYVFYEKYEEN